MEQLRERVYKGCESIALHFINILNENDKSEIHSVEFTELTETLSDSIIFSVKRKLKNFNNDFCGGILLCALARTSIVSKVNKGDLEDYSKELMDIYEICKKEFG